MLICYVILYTPSVSLERLHKLCWSIIVWDVEPKSMRNSSWHTFTKTERVSTNIICTFSEGVIKGIEEQGSGWTQKVFNMLLECIDRFSRWIIGNLSHKNKNNQTLNHMIKKKRSSKSYILMKSYKVWTLDYKVNR